MLPKIVVFDLGDVILKLDWKKPLQLMGLDYIQAGHVFKSLLTGPDGIYDRYERGQLSDSEFFDAFKKHFGLKMSIPEIKSAWVQLVVGPVQGIDPMFAKIPSHYDKYALTNISENVYRHLKLDSTEPLYPILSKFRKIYSSFEMQLRKPQREIYEKLVFELQTNHPGIVPSDILFIDDRLENVEGARTLGIQAERCMPSDLGCLESILKKYRLLPDRN